MPSSLNDLFTHPFAPILIGVVVTWGMVEIAARGIGPSARARAMRRWLAWSVAGGLVAGRAVHVAGNLDGFDPLGAAAFWDGGLSGQAVLVTVLVITAVALGRQKENVAPTLRAAVVGLVAGWGIAVFGGAGGGLPDPAHRYETLDGRGFDLASHFALGRPVVLNLWATWCGPCRRELPLFQEVAEQSQGITFAFASQREPAQRVALFIAAEGLRLPNVVLDTDGRLGRRYAGFGLPTTLFIRPDGTVQGVHVGEIPRDRLEAGIAALRTGR